MLWPCRWPGRGGGRFGGCRIGPQRGLSNFWKFRRDDTVLSSLRTHGQASLAVRREACPVGLEASWSSHTLPPAAGGLTPAAGGGLGCPFLTPPTAQRPDAEAWSPGHPAPCSGQAGRSMLRVVCWAGRTWNLVPGLPPPYSADFRQITPLWASLSR